MTNTKLYFLVDNFGELRSGIENSVLLRARSFYKCSDLIPTIITKEYNIHLPIFIKKMVDNYLISNEMEFLNLYNYYQKENSASIKVKEPILGVLLPKDAKKEDIKKNKYYREKIVEYETIEYKGSILRKNIFDLEGYLSSSHVIEEYAGKMYFTETYYRLDGTICIVKRFNLDANNHKNELKHIQLLNGNEEAVFQFESEEELFTHWFTELFDNEFQHYLVVDRAMFYTKPLLAVNLKNVYSIYVIHSSHVRVEAANGTTALNYNYKDVFRNLNKVNAIIVHTEAQKRDLEARYGQLDNLFVIPHPLENIVEYNEALLQNRKPYSIVYLARYSHEKMHPYLLKVFSKVLKYCPKANLELYGFGADKEKIQALVKNMGLTKKVKVDDFVQNTQKILEKASLAVLPSSVEGFSLFVQESIGHGLPVVSHDIDYGPREMIDDGVNGFLTKPLDEDQMVKAIVKVLNSKTLAESMSKASIDKSKQFSQEIVIEKWHTLLDELSMKGK